MQLVPRLFLAEGTIWEVNMINMFAILRGLERQYKFNKSFQHGLELAKNGKEKDALMR